MMIKAILTLILTSLIALSSFAESFKPDDIIGFWLTKEERGVIQIFKEKGKYKGKLVWLVDIQTGKKKNPLDDHNPEVNLRSKPLLNMINMYGFHFEDNEWVGGHIYDPKSGKLYSAKIELKDKNHLNLRGYVGIPLFGKTSSWTRQSGVTPARWLKK